MDSLHNQTIMYIVTVYGCNSTPSDMYAPKSKLFLNYDDAYSWFIEASPSLDDEENIAEQTVNSKYSAEDITSNYIVIENRVQIAGYHCGELNCAKRPYGVLIARIILKN